MTTIAPTTAEKKAASPGGARDEPLLRVEDLRIHFPIRTGVLQRTTGHLKAVDGVSFSIRRGEVLGLVGESGCGKSTVGRAILRLIPATSGRIIFDGRDVLALGVAELRALRRRMQIVFQDPGGSLNPRLRVGTIVAEPLEVHGVVAGRDALRARAADLLERCGMPRDAIDRYPHEFSGGQRQRIAIARAIALKPDLIVCDEPTSALDASIQAQILNLLADLRDEFGLAYLFISHDIAVVRHLCDRVAVMLKGTIVEEGPRDQVIDAPKHDYTRALIAAVPVANPRRVRPLAR